MFVALGIRYAKGMRRVMLSSGACPAVQYFLHYHITITTFGKKLRDIKCVLIFSTTVVLNIPYSKKNSAAASVV
jgi:hypothetical protein